jgi:hypothetical protein
MEQAISVLTDACSRASSFQASALIQKVELANVLDDERAVDRTDPVESFGVVVDDEETRARGLQPVEPEIGRPIDPCAA